VGDTRAGEQLRAFIGAMHVMAGLAADGIARAIQAGPARSLLDVGGGPGPTAWRCCAEPPPEGDSLRQARVVELAVLSSARPGSSSAWTWSAAISSRIRCRAATIWALLSAIIHSYSLERNTALYRKIFEALLPGGRLVVRDHGWRPTARDPRGRLFAVNMLVNTEGGGCYTTPRSRPA